MRVVIDASARHLHGLPPEIRPNPAVTVASLHAVATRFGPPVLAGIMEYAECDALLVKIAWRHLNGAAMPAGAFDRICWSLTNTLNDAIDSPALAAAQAVRDAVRPLLAQRRPRATVLLAAYRTGGDDLAVSEVEAIAREEVETYIQERRLVAA